MPGKKSFWSSWMPWAIGGVAVVGIGTAAVIYSKRDAKPNPAMNVPAGKKLIKIVFWNDNEAVFVVPGNTPALKGRKVMHSIPKSWVHIASTALQPSGHRMWFMNKGGMFKKAPVDMRKLFTGLPLYGEHSPKK